MNLLATVGSASILTALACSVFALVGGIAAGPLRRPDLGEAARRALVVAAGLVTLAAAALLTALLRDDFSIDYVTRVSSRDLETPLKVAAFYSSQAGSLLFWSWITALLFALFALHTVPKIPWGASPAVAASGGVLAALLIPLAFMASPFRLSPFATPDGLGLNPLLVDRGMLVHPPMLLGGLASTAVPFVLGVAALAAGRLDGTWLRVVRPWALGSWLVLSIGNVLGGWWAYTVLGWGGYWGWDPVENSAILPLLPMTAFLHSVMIQERRGMLKLWNLGLAFLAFALAVFGTFNVRSGLVNSVHSFAQSSVGPYFLVMLAIAVVVSAVLLFWRAPSLRAESDFVSLASRESVLVVNNYLLITMALVVFGGTLFPVFSELYDGSRITVGPAFFNEVMGPLLLALLVLVAVGTVVPWRQAARPTLLARFRWPVLASAALATVLFALGMRDASALVGVVSAFAIAFVTAREFWVGARASRRAGAAHGARPSWLAAFLGLLDRDPRRYGGYLVHVALAVMAVAVIASSVYQQQGRLSLSPGDSAEFAGYTFRYDGLRQRQGTANGIDADVIAPLFVTRGGEAVTRLEPGRRVFRNFPEQPTAVVGLHSSLTRDLYVFIEGWDDDQRVHVQVFVNPLVVWLWIGAAMYAAGGLIAFAPLRAPSVVRREVAAPAPSRVTGA
ncbi:MAG: heme lyase CcmF/NrfE family subunit [Dehalococcoidia bacterium]|nr:heme lyase CcmF/NrfE family subunit [Dehalococcoidia bacterium]